MLEWLKGCLGYRRLNVDMVVMVTCWYDCHGYMLVWLSWLHVGMIVMVTCWYDCHGYMLV